MATPRKGLSTLVGYGGIVAIAKKLAMKPGTVSAALRRGTPSHIAVREALRIAEESGALSAAQKIATLPISI